MPYSSNQNAGGLDVLTDATVATGDLIIVGDVSDSNRAKAFSLNSLLTYLASAVMTFTNKTLTSPKINENVVLTATATQLNRVDATSSIQTQLDARLPLTGGTMSGNITLAENASIDLDSVLSADGKYTGECITGTAGTTLAFGDLIYLSASDSRWELADADSATTSQRLLGMCVLAAANDGDATKILLRGHIRADAAFPALTIGSPAYVGETAGDIQTAIPTGADNVVRVVGYATTADALMFDPSPTSQLTVA